MSAESRDDNFVASGFFQNYADNSPHCLAKLVLHSRRTEVNSEGQNSGILVHAVIWFAPALRFVHRRLMFQFSRNLALPWSASRRTALLGICRRDRGDRTTAANRPIAERSWARRASATGSSRTKNSTSI